MEPCLIFIDEIDVICPKRDGAQKEMERRIVAQLKTCLDGTSTSLQVLTFSDLCVEGEQFRRIVVLGATNRSDALDSSIRSSGRFRYRYINQPTLTSSKQRDSYGCS